MIGAATGGVINYFIVKKLYSNISVITINIL